jgi:branched-chain amino acid transport system ATP-binding protein
MSEAMLEIRDLELRYGGVPAVRGLSLRVERGEVVGLVGPNGAGKTSTLLAIMGVVQPYRGEILHAGRPLAGLGTDAIVRSGVALVPEGRQIFPELTVEENLRLGLVGRRMRDGAEEDLARVAALFPVVTSDRHRPAGVLSGGQQQQLAIARALVARPDLLLLDEPSLGLAPMVVREFFRIVRQLNEEEGLTVLVVEQDARIALASSSRAYVLEVGRVALSGSSDDLRENESVRRSYLGY